MARQRGAPPLLCRHHTRSLAPRVVARGDGHSRLGDRDRDGGLVVAAATAAAATTTNGDGDDDDACRASRHITLLRDALGAPAPRGVCPALPHPLGHGRGGEPPVPLLHRA